MHLFANRAFENALNHVGYADLLLTRHLVKLVPELVRQADV